MRAVVADGGSVRLVDVAEPSGDGRAVRVAEAGICGSDLHMVASGVQRVTLGHEFCGHLDDGTLVAVRPTGACDACDACTRGHQTGCSESWSTAHGIGIDGGLADSVVVDPRRLFPMPAGARTVDAALVEPLAICWHGVRRAAPEPGSRALVVGAGSIGLLTVAALRAWGVEADIVSRHPHQSAAAEALGARVVDTPKAWSYATTFDAVCTQASFDACVTAARAGGLVLEFGMFWTSVQLSNAMMFKEVSLVPTMGYSHLVGHGTADHDDFRETADHVAANPHIADVLVTHTFPLAEAEEAFRVAADRSSGAIKVHLVP